MSIAHDILPECFVDTNIVNTFLTMEGIYVDANHCHGCNKVGNMMQQQLKDEFALGVIDNDKSNIHITDNFIRWAKRSIWNCLSIIPIIIILSE